MVLSYNIIVLLKYYLHNAYAQPDFKLSGSTIKWIILIEMKNKMYLGFRAYNDK